MLVLIYNPYLHFIQKYYKENTSENGKRMGEEKGGDVALWTTLIGSCHIHIKIYTPMIWIIQETDTKQKCQVGVD